MSDDPGYSTHTLTYQGKVDPRPGTIMGPTMDKHPVLVLGAIYDAERDVTEVMVEKITDVGGPPSRPELAASGG